MRALLLTQLTLSILLCIHSFASNVEDLPRIVDEILIQEKTDSSQARTQAKNHFLLLKMKLEEEMHIQSNLLDQTSGKSDYQVISAADGTRRNIATEKQIRIKNIDILKKALEKVQTALEKLRTR